MNNYTKDLKTWNEDKYNIAIVQRNLLFILAFLTSIALLVALLILKSVYQKKKIEPYIIEFNKSNGKVQVLETKSHKQYTSNRITREALVVDYIRTREALAIDFSLEERLEKIRLTSSPIVYNAFKIEAKEVISKMKNFGVRPRYKIDIKTIKFTRDNAVKVKFSKQLISDSQIEKEKTFDAEVLFNFVNMDLNIEELYINPHKFQVAFYKIDEIKTFDEEKN